MELDHEACYRALSTRDARFDGRMFTAVRTTGVYCRPICPARTPRPENVTFYPTAAAAQEAGFRPWLRCRPETRRRSRQAFVRVGGAGRKPRPTSARGAARRIPYRAPWR